MRIVHEALWKAKAPCMFVGCCSATVLGNGHAAIYGGELFDAMIRDRTVLSDIGSSILLNGAEFGFQEIRSARRPGKGGLAIFQNRSVVQQDFVKHLMEISLLSLFKWMDQNPDIPVRLEHPGQSDDIKWINQLTEEMLKTKNLTVCRP